MYMSRGKEIFYSSLGQDNINGWGFNMGEPEFWKHTELFVPKGQLLDLGAGGFGRSSLPFAIRGMNVTGIDNSGNNVELLRTIAKENNLPIDVIEADVRTQYLGKNMYDTVLASQVFVHFDSKTDAFNVLENVVDALKPGGYVWVRAVGKLDDTYSELEFEEAERVNEDVFMMECGCSGEIKSEPTLFFGQLELPFFMAKRGLKIVHTQVMSNVGSKNIMYGEDWDMGQPYDFRHGEVTVIARKWD